MNHISKPIAFLTLCAFGACLLCGCSLAMLAQFYGIDGPTVQEGQERADKLLIALEQYKHDTGNYPSDLDLLVPTYLPTIPRPAWRWSYEYERQSDGEKFVISFMVGKNIDGDYCEYSSLAQTWQCTDSI